MTKLPESARAVLQSAALAHLVTLDADGRPQVSIVWVGLDGEEIVAAHLPEHRKVRNMRRDPRSASRALGRGRHPQPDRRHRSVGWLTEGHLAADRASRPVFLAAANRLRVLP